MNKLLVVVDGLPYSKCTEEDSCLIDFIQELTNAFGNPFQFQISDILKKEFHENYSIGFLCPKDSTSIPLLKKAARKMVDSGIEHLFIYQPTLKYLTSEMKGFMHDLMSGQNPEWKLVTNNNTWTSGIRDSRVYCTHSISEKYLESSQGSKETSLAILDLLESTSIMYSDLSMKEITPFVDGQRSRKIEGLSKMLVLSNLGMSSLRVPIESLNENYLDINGIYWKCMPEMYIHQCKELVYPSLKSKAFGRWGYIAHHLNIPVKSDHIHGYQLFNGCSLESIVDSIHKNCT